MKNKKTAISSQKRSYSSFVLKSYLMFLSDTHCSRACCGQLYREKGLTTKLKDLFEQEMIELLATDGMLVKRPLLITDSDILVGFKEAEWEETFL